MTLREYWESPRKSQRRLSRASHSQRRLGLSTLPAGAHAAGATKREYQNIQYLVRRAPFVPECAPAAALR